MAKYRKLGKDSAARKALIRNQVTALIQNDKIVTTLARAKEVQKQVEKLTVRQFTYTTLQRRKLRETQLQSLLQESR